VTRWAVLTGEYPPQTGGVSDYTRLVAGGLAAAGDAVTVFAPPAAGADPRDPGVTVRRLPDWFGPRGLAALGRELARRPRPDRILVQYVPHAFGLRGMNLPFCAWLACFRRASVWVMFHEVATPWVRGQPWRHQLLGAATAVMAHLLLRRADRVLVSTPSWEPVLRRFRRRFAPVTWLPVPSNLPGRTDAAAVARARAGFPGGAVVIGHFGTFGTLIAPLLAATLPALLAADPARLGMLIGRGAAGFADNLARAHPALADRLFAAPGLSDEEAADRLRACDLLVQPFPDGVSTRRTSVMAGLALGVPVVTNEGILTEPVWRESGCAALARRPDPSEILAAAAAVLAAPEPTRAELGRRGAEVYEARFGLRRTVEALRGESAGTLPAADQHPVNRNGPRRRDPSTTPGQPSAPPSCGC
jgi:glycosyltransferase involved in cell wall biosynthesis